MITTINALLIAYLPVITAIIGIICSIIKIAKDNKAIIKPLQEQFSNLRKEVQDKTELEAVKKEMLAIMTENRQLRQEMADLITEMRKQKYELPDKEV